MASCSGTVQADLPKCNAEEAFTVSITIWAKFLTVNVPSFGKIPGKNRYSPEDLGALVAGFGDKFGVEASFRT